MVDYRRSMFGVLTLISVISVFNLVVALLRIRDFFDFRTMNILLMGFALASAWYLNLRERRRTAPTADAALYKTLASAIFAMGVLVNVCIQMGLGLLNPAKWH
jgi:Na+-transporting NADH:ubiquinone oxidoreductase subunit NqrB